MKQVGWGYVDRRGFVVLQTAKPTARTKGADGRPVEPFPVYAEADPDWIRRKQGG